MRSRLAGGLCVDIGSLDETLRSLNPHHAHRGPENDPPHLRGRYERHRLCSPSGRPTGRDLEGAGLLHATLAGSAIALGTATAIRRTAGSPTKDIQKAGDMHYNVSRSRHPVGAPHRRRGAPAPDPPCTCPGPDLAFPARDQPRLRRAGPRLRCSAPRAQDREGLGEDHALSDEVELLKRMLQDNTCGQGAAPALLSRATKANLLPCLSARIVFRGIGRDFTRNQVLGYRELPAARRSAEGAGHVHTSSTTWRSPRILSNVLLRADEGSLA